MILSPEEFYRLNEIEEDYALLLEATERLASSNAEVYSFADVMKELGISQDEIDNAEDVIIK